MSDVSLKARIAESIKQAMKAREAARLGTLRLIAAAIKQKEVDERIELTDADVIAILEKQVKQRRESIAAYELAGRTETAEQEKAEMAVLQEFLPAQADADEIHAVIEAALAEVAGQGVSGPAAMGKIMALVKPRLAGRADMAAISQQIKARLN